MAKRILTIVFCVAILSAAILRLRHAQPVRAQQGQLQIASFAVGPEQTLTYPSAPPASPYLFNVPDEHTTFIPPASSTSPYVIFMAAGIAGQNFGVNVLQTTDLQTFSFATSLGYNPQVMTSPVLINQCNPAYDSEFDENYVGPAAVVQDPMLPAGNLIMLYEAETYCAGGTPQNNEYASIGFARSSDNGKTWPAPENGPLGGPNRYPVLQSSVPLPSTPSTSERGDTANAGLIDKSVDGNTYLYFTYSNFGDVNQVRIARAPLGQTNLSFLKWYGGSFSQPGIGGLDSGPMSGGCPGSQNQSQISYNDDLGLYMWTFLCLSGSTTLTGTWYYSTATSLDLQDWSTPQLIANSQTSCFVDGWYPSFMSPGAANGHTKLTGTIFYLNDCTSGAPSFKSRTFTITTRPQPPPVLTSGSLANGATYVAGGLVPGSWAQVQGTGLATTTRIWAGLDFVNLGNTLPTNLSGVQVMVNNTPAPVYYISPTQIDFQVPTGITGTASVQVLVNGTASNTITAAAASSSPGLFPNTVNGVNYPAATYASGTNFVGPAGVPGYIPASVGYHISLYATGLMAQPAGVIPTAQQISGVTVNLGGVVIPADYAGQTPYVGEFQINFTVPQVFANMPAANYPISISLNGVSSPTTINTSPPGQIVVAVVP